MVIDQKESGMFGLFRQKMPPKPPPTDDKMKSDLANAIASLLGIQLLLLPPEYKRIEGDGGHVYRKSIGYVYGYIDAFLRMRGYDMSDNEIGVPITFHVLRKLFPEHDPVRYVEFLAASLQDETVHLGMMHGGQLCIDYSKPEAQGAPMGLFRFILEDSALQTA
jgi:hypothetical protein